ncbi:MAG: ring-cleaving dioxygenase [Verrucomicrobiota bacterium]
MQAIQGLHHVTAIAGPAQENLDFYAGILGMRLVKRSVNQDDPGSYHLFYADAEGHPGTDLTFFPWTQMAANREGYGLSSEVALAVPPGSLHFWSDRLFQHDVSMNPREVRFGQEVLPITDRHGLHLALVESQDSLGRPFTPWSGSPIPAEHQIRGLESARMIQRDLIVTASFLIEAMGFKHLGTENGWHRYGLGEGGSGTYVELHEMPMAGRGVWGRGSIHHLAWRVADEAHQLELRQRAVAAGAHATFVIDRFWFKSVYFPEPGGVLFELATDGPGFAVDEDSAHLGESLVLPPWLETNRTAIEAALPKLTMPGKQRITVDQWRQRE